MNKFNTFLYRVSFLIIIFSFNLTIGNELTLEPVKENQILSKNFLKKINNIFNITTFIETGTWIGHSTRVAAEVFDQVLSIELSTELYSIASENLKEYKNIKLYNGDSANLLEGLLKKELGKTLIWLDGHYSGEHFGYNTALGKTNTPILSELENIKNSALKDIIIMIDDIRLFDKRFKDLVDLKIGDYPDIVEIYNIIKQINPNYEIVIIGDVLAAYPKNDKVSISKILKACTLSRLGIHGDKFILEIEKDIINAKGHEREELRTLHLAHLSQGIGDYYSLWYALTLINVDKYSAQAILENLKLKNFQLNRVMHYLDVLKAK